MHQKHLFYLCDLDGTLLDHPMRISAPYVEGLNELIQKGMNLTLSTGRSMNSARQAINGLILNYPGIYMDGGVLGDLQTNHVFKINEIPNTTRDEIFQYWEFIKEYPLSFNACHPTNYDQIHLRKDWNQLASFPLHGLTQEELAPYKEFALLGFFYYSKQSYYQEIVNQFQTRFAPHTNVFFFDEFSRREQKHYQWMQVTSNTSGKESLLPNLAQHLNIDPDDIIYFGDSLNDLIIMQEVGMAIAPENAVPEVKAIATEIIGPAKEGSVYKYLKKQFQGTA